MQAEDIYYPEVDKIFQSHNPSPNYYSSLTQFLTQECKANPDNTRRFLTAFQTHPPVLINFNAFAKIARIIKKITTPLKNPELEHLLSSTLMQYISLYFSHPITPNNYKKFQQFLDLFQNLATLQADNLNDQKKVIVTLTKNNYSQQWENALVELINNEVLVDKKNQQTHFLKVNKYFGPFVVKNIDRLIPQLERLLIRSESNFQIWEDFILAVENWKGVDQHLLPLIHKIKSLFLNNVEGAIRIVNTLTNSLTDERAIKDFVGFILGMIGGEHNAKKKIVYVRMLEGILSSLKNHQEEKVRNQFSQDILVSIVNSLVKFTEQQEFNFLTAILNDLLPLITEPRQDVARAIKIYLKNQNKYILIVIGLVLAHVYKKEHINKLPVVKEIFTHFKTTLALSIKKAQANWQWLLPTIYFLSEGEAPLIDNLSEQMPMFKVSCLSLSKIEKKTCLKLILRYISYQKEEEEQISNNVFVISALLLQDLKERLVWQQFISALTTEEKLSLVTKGVFPLTLFNCAELKKNRGNSFQSLLLYVWHQLRNQKITVTDETNFIRVICLYSKAKPLFLKSFLVQQPQLINSTIELYVNSSLFDSKNDEENTVSQKQVRHIDWICDALLRYQQQYLVALLEQFTKEDYYTKDLEFLVDFEAKVKESLRQVKSDLQQISDQLAEKDIYKEEAVKPRKVYLATNFQIKMMSEQEVKADKYRQHFLKMLAFFDKIVNKLLDSLNKHSLICSLWQHNLKSILTVTKYPEHRISIQKLIKKSCRFSAWYNQKCTESKLFSKHSDFLGQFFALRHSGITPAVKLMNHCELFLKQLLSLNFQNPTASFQMLQVGQSQFVMLFVNEMCEYLLQNMQFDVNLKRNAIRFYYKTISRKSSFHNEERLFTHIVTNINILASSDHIQFVLLHLLQEVDQNRFHQIFTDILNFIQTTKKLILHTITLLKDQYKPEFEEFIKLKILALESNPEISRLAQEILAKEGELKKSILTFNMKNFVKKNSKQTVQKLCQFIKEQITAESCEPIFLMVMKASEELFDEGFDQEGLEMFPYFLNLNIEAIIQALYKPIFELLIIKFTAKEQYGTLSKLSVEAGINIIKRNAESHAEKLLLVLEGFINKATGVSNIIFLGVLAPHLEGNKNLQLIQRRITELFKSNKENEQRAISKCMSDLMSFFKNPEQIVQSIFSNIGTLPTEELQVGQAYLFSGLLKGIGYKLTQEYLDKILAKEYLTKTKQEKSGRIYLVNALIQNFGRVVELKGIKIIEIMIGYTADNSEEIRNLAKKTGQSLIVKMSSFSVKILLPQLLKGLEQEQNWRIKISYIWILGIMANCSAKQLQTSLPIIVPTLSTCLSNAHPIIREKASQALNLIGQTIKNPQVSQCVHILIEALQNPFQNSQKAIEILLKTNFNHYIDPPALSMIIPILDYCMRGRVSDLKAGACQVIGSIVELISNSYDLLPYLRIITTGLKVALCDPLSQIRCIAAMAIGKISNKIGMKQAELYFKFVLEIIESPLSNTTERQGAAQAQAQIICSHTYEYFQESLNKIFEKLNSIKHSEKQGYILIFLYVPSIKTQEFEGFIKEVNENMYGFVSDEEENIRNSAMMVEKVLINNYCLTHTDLLLGPLCDGVFENNWKKRNAAIILIGELLNIIKSHMYNTRSTDKAYAYYRGLMAVYIIKDDELEMTRYTANQVWNAYIENTPKTIKLGLYELVRMWTRFTHRANGVVFTNIIAFSSKYGENYFSQILNFLIEYIHQPEHQVGVFEVLSEFIKRLNLQFLSKQVYKTSLRELFTDNLFTIPDNVRSSLSNALALYVDKMHQQRFFEDLLYPTIQKMDLTEQLSGQYTKNLHLVKDLLRTKSDKVVDRVVNKVMEAPMSEFKIEVITNNADRLANFLYTHFKRPATEVLVEEIYLLIGSKAKQNRLSLIIYCLEQVSLQLNSKHKDLFIRMINSNIYKLINTYTDNQILPRNKSTLMVFINMLLYFLNSTPLMEIQDLDTIIGQISPLVFFADAQLRSSGHRIFLLLIADHKSPKTSEYIRQMVVSFQNKITVQNQMIWEDEVIFKDYVTTLVKCIAYGNSDTMEESLEMVEFIMQHTPRELVEKEILRIVGPIVRISNYALLQKQKISIMEILINILKQNFRIDPYINQILSICLRLLQEFKNSEEVMRVIADTYMALIISTSLKQELVLAILGKIKTFGANLVHSFYYLVKSILQDKVELPKTLYEKIYEQCHSLLMLNTANLPVKALYYASKVSARLAVFMGKPIEKVEAQLSGLTCSYESIINYLHFAYYKKTKIPRLNTIEIFIKESNREKVHYLLKSLKLCAKTAEQNKKLYSQQYIRNLVPETLVGFDEIGDMIERFESERPIQDIIVLQAEINVK